MNEFVATCGLGSEPALVAELDWHGIPAEATGKGAVTFRGDLAQAYTVCLWSRVASRVLLPLARVPAYRPQALVDGVRDLGWQHHLAPGLTFAVQAVGRNPALRNSHFTALAVKDGIVDCLRDARGDRPDVDTRSPDLRVHVLVRGDQAQIAIDLSGDALHFRGGRDGGPAPLRETLAATLLWLADWPALAREGTALVDPMCGSGTILREAAGMALDRAPGLGRRRWGFHGWSGHDASVWEEVVEAAKARERSRLPCEIHGFDIDREQVERARRNLAHDELEALVPVTRSAWARLEPPTPGREELPHGILVTNPPYGERLGEREEVEELIGEIGNRLRRHWLGWVAYVLVGDTGLAKKLGLRPTRRIPIRNGSLEARLLEVPIATRKVARDQ